MPLNLLAKEDRLIRDVYPKSKLQASEPNSQELSRLTYHLSNKPSKLNHIASEVASKAEADAKKAGSNARYKASLMVTLHVLKSLCEECRRDLPLFSQSVLKAVSYALDVKLAPAAGPASAGVDLEILARASSVFRAFTTYTLLPPDTPALASLYHSILRRFAALAVLSDARADDETVLRIRLLALAAISSSVTSDILGGRQYRAMVEVIAGSLLGCCEGVAISDLLAQSEEEPSSSHPIATTSAPELRLRRAQSVHHVPGLPGPTQDEISHAAISSFRSLVQHANGAQIGVVVEVLCAWLDKGKRWERQEWVGGLVEGMAAWGGVQYRYVLPSTLAEILLQLADGPSDDVKRATLLAALTRLLGSQLSLIGLSPSTLLGSLLTLLSRQPSPDVLKAIGALASKVYYKDQNIDFVEEALGRLDGAGGPERLLPLLDASRVILTAGRGGESAAAGTKPVSSAAGERNHVPPDVLGPSVHLLGHANAPVRASYSALVATYIHTELPSGEDGDARFLARVLSTLHDLLQTTPPPSAASSPVMPGSTRSSPRQRRVSLMVNPVQPQPADYAAASVVLVAVADKGGPQLVRDVVGLLASLQHAAGAEPLEEVWRVIGERYAPGQPPLTGESDVRARAIRLAESASLQQGTGMDQATLAARLLSPYSPAFDTDRASTTEPAGTLKPADGVMAGENASILSFAYAGGAVGGKQREGLGVGDLREALTGRSSMSTTHLANRTPSLASTVNHPPSIRGAGSIKTAGRGKTLKGKPDDVADLFRRLGIGKEGKKSKLAAGASRSSSSGQNGNGSSGSRILKAEDLDLGPIVKNASRG